MYIRRYFFFNWTQTLTEHLDDNNIKEIQIAWDINK